MSTFRKATTAALVGRAGAVGAALADDALTSAECLVAAGTGLLAAVAVYEVPNTD